MAAVEKEFAEEVARKSRVTFDYTGVSVIEDSDRKCRVLSLGYIGTEHLLWALSDVDSPAKDVLTNMGASTTRVGSAIVHIIGRGHQPIAGKIGATPRYLKIIDLAAEEAARRKSQVVNSTDLLLGLVKEGEGIGAGVLESLGVSLDRVRFQVRYVLERAEKVKPKLLELTPAQQAQITRITRLYREPSMSPTLRDNLYSELQEQVIGFESLVGIPESEDNPSN